MGVIMTETEFSMVSEWMSNGNINQFVAVNRDANRFEIVSSLSAPQRSSQVIDNCVASTVERCCKGPGLYA